MGSFVAKSFTNTGSSALFPGNENKLCGKTKYNSGFRSKQEDLSRSAQSLRSRKDKRNIPVNLAKKFFWNIP